MRRSRAEGADSTARQRRIEGDESIFADIEICCLATKGAQNLRGESADCQEPEASRPCRTFSLRVAPRIGVEVKALRHGGKQRRNPALKHVVPPCSMADQERATAPSKQFADS